MSKWILPSMKEYEESESMYQDHNRAIQAESDLTEALDMLEETVAKLDPMYYTPRIDKINDFLNKFRSHK